MEPIVTAAWLSTAPADVVVCHVGTVMRDADPYSSYLNRHLPGARYLSLDTDLAGPPGAGVGRHPLPSPESFAASLNRVGVGDDTRVVGYDDAGGAFAARLVWMLRILGQGASLLSGGLSAWTGGIAHGPVGTEPAERRVAEWPAGAIADADAVAAHVGAGGVVIDSRDAPRYRGEIEPIDAVAGHIPGAIDLPFPANLADGVFRSAAELADRFVVIGDDPEPIVYCGSGVTACHNALAVEASGRPLPRVYVGSWSGWSTDPTRPIAVGDESHG